MKQKFVDYYMAIADATAQLSSAIRLKVGSVIVRDQKILATGYNGTPTGWDNSCEDLLPDGALKTKATVLHAESNAIAKVAKSTESSDGATLFCTHAPCMECAKLIYQSGINKVYYRHTYRDSSGLEFLENGGIKVERYPATIQG